MKYERILAAINDKPWVITEEGMSAILAIVEMRIDGRRLSEEELNARVAANRRQRTKGAGNILVMPLHGPIAHRMNLLNDVSGVTSIEVFGDEFEDAMKDDNVAAVVLDIDSPGGEVSGIPELFDRMMSLRGRKNVVAVSNTQMSSGALWIGSAADTIIASPSAIQGSLGVRVQHIDRSKKIENDGLVITHITSAKAPGKLEMRDDAPLSDPDRERLQAVADDLHDDFERAVAKGRKMPVADVRSNFGKGRQITAREALNAGMVDGIAPLREVVSRLAKSGGEIPREWQRDSRASVSTSVPVALGCEECDEYPIVFAPDARLEGARLCQKHHDSRVEKLDAEASKTDPDPDPDPEPKPEEKSALTAEDVFGQWQG